MMPSNVQINRHLLFSQEVLFSVSHRFLSFDACDYNFISKHIYIYIFNNVDPLSLRNFPLIIARCVGSPSYHIQYAFLMINDNV